MSENSAKIRVTAQDDTKSGLDSAKRNFAGLKSGVADAADGVDGFRTAVSGAVAALGVTAFAGWVKGAIDSADALNDLSEQTGIAAGKLSEYQYAAQMSGTSLDTLSTGFKELAKGIASNGDALKSIGVATRDAAGNLRGTDQVLEDVAEKFAGYEDGAAKSALAMQLFGKAGQEMIPFLNNGKEGLAELRGEAQSLGVVLSDDMVAAAANFNDGLDKLKTAGGGFAAQLAGELLPALGVVSDSLLGTAQDSGVLKDATAGIAVGLKGLVSVGYGVAHVFTQIGDGFGALAAAAAAAISGNWAQAKQIIADSGDQMAARDAALAGKIEKIWGDVPPAVEKSASDAAGKALRAQAPVVAKAKENATATKSAYDTLLESMRKQLQQTEKLTATEKLSQELAQKKYATLSHGQREHLQSIAEEIDSSKRLQQQAEATAKWLDDSRTAQNKSLQDLQAEYKKAKEEVENYGLSPGQIADRDLQLLQEQIDAERALNAEIGVGGSQYLSHLEQQLALRQQIVVETEKLDTLDAGKKAAEEAAAAFRKTAEAAQKTNDAITQGLTDALMRGFENGKGFAENLRDTTVNMFKTMVLTPAIQGVLTPVVGGVQTAWAGINGGISNAAAAFAKSGFGQAVGLSTAPVELAGPTMTGEALTGTALTGAGATFAASAGPVLGALVAAYAVAEMNKGGWGEDNNAKGYAKMQFLQGGVGSAVVFDRLFGHNRNISNDAQGITGTFDLSGFTGQSFQEKSQKGGAFRSDRRWTDYSAIGSDMDKALDSMLKQAVSGVQTIGKALNVETENALQGFSHTFALQLSENGDMSKAGEKIAAELKKVQDELVTKLVPNIEDFARYGESAADTFGRLNQEVTATDAILLAMGKNASEAFGAVGLASIKAREDLIDLAGGLDKLASKTQAFYQAYYSSSEQQQLAAKQAQQVLVTGFADIGQSIPASRAAFRGLVEAQDLSTEAGRKLWNSLLDLSDEFDTVQKLADAAAESTKAATQSQASLFDSFASDAQKLDAARKLVGDTFASIGKDVPASSAAFLQLTQAIDPATEAGQSLITALNKISGAFAYVQTTASAAAKATLTGQASKIEGDMQSLVARFGSLSPVARTVADDLAATQQQLAGLSDGLANLFGGKQLSDLEKLGQTVNYRTQIRSAISQLNDDIFEAALKGMSRPQQIEQLKKAEADLWAGMASAADKGQQASRIRSVVLRRLGLESDEANGAASKAADLAKQARQDQIETLRTQIDGMQRLRDLAGQIADFSANLSIGDLSTLDFTGQLAAAKQLFEQTATAAASGDTKAQGNLTANARTYLEEARAYFASSSNYAAIYDAVNGQLKSIAGTSPTDSAISNAQTQIDQLQKLPDVMASVVDTSQMQIETLRSVQSALRSGDEYLSKSIDKQTEAMQQQIDALHTLANNQQAQIVQAGAAYTAMTEELRQVKAKLAAIENNGALVAAGG